jgi:cell division protein FtsL
MDIDFAGRKDILNRPIPKEIDRTRQRELWQWVGVVLPLAAILLVSVWQHVELVRHHNQMEQMQRELARQEEVTRQLRLAVATLESPERIREIAINQLHLASPEDVTILTRITPPDPPPASVVAAR